MSHRVFKGAAACCALLVACPAAHAQQSTFDAMMASIQTYRSTTTRGVTFYGVADGNVGYYRSSSSRSIYQVGSGGASTSRIGFSGNEDLGDGLGVRFVLEGASGIDVGTVGGTQITGETSFFNRESNVTLYSRSWGEIKLGRQYPMGGLPLFVDPFFGVSAFSVWATVGGATSDLGRGANGGDSRISNSVAYTSPTFDGFTGAVGYGARESTADGFPKAAYVGGNLQYQKGPWFVGLSYAEVRSDPVSATKTPSVNNKNSGIGVMYDLGGSIVSYSFNSYLPQLEGDRVAQVHSLGLIAASGVHTYRASLVYRNVSGNGDQNSLAIALGYEYNLSRRTSLYSRFASVQNQSKAIGSLGYGRLDAPGDHPMAIAFGVRTRF